MSQTKAQLIDPTDGSIVNADINASAAIAKTKIETFVNNNADNRVITGSGTANTLNGESSVVIDSSGNLGIGAGTPRQKLHISASDSSSANMVFTNSTTGTSAGDGFIVGITGGEDAQLNMQESANLKFSTADTERMRIDSSGRVGIGATSFNDAAEYLLVKNDSTAANVSIVASNNAHSSLNLGDEDDFNIQKIRSDHTDNSLQFFTNNTERLTIDSSGKVGIGITPTAPFHVKHATTNAVAHFESGDANVSIKFLDNSTSTAPAIGATGDNLTISTGGLERVNVNGSNGRVGIGTTSQANPLHVFHSTNNASIRAESGDEYVHMEFKDSTTSNVPYVGAQGDKLRLITGGSERLRIEDDNEGTGFGGATLVTYNNMATHSGTGSEGARIRNDGAAVFGTSNNTVLKINRRSSDGALVEFLQNGSSEGSIGVSGSAVSYNGGHLSRWSQLKGVSTTDKSARPLIYQGTVMSNLDDLCSWSHAEVLYDEDVLYTLEDTLPEGKSVGDVKIAKGTVRKEAYTEENQQLNMTKISDTEGDKDVAGVFWTWDDDDDEIVNDFYVAMTGDMVIRVAASTTVTRGDLMISAGDGTAKPQADDIIRSSTIAKIISTNHTATYADGSKAYPCVLMAC